MAILPFCIEYFRSIEKSKMPHSLDKPLRFVQASHKQASLLRKLHALTLSDATPSIGKIHPLRKMAVTLEPVMSFECPSRFRISKKINIVYFMTQSTISNHKGVAVPYRYVLKG